MRLVLTAAERNAVLLTAQCGGDVRRAWNVLYGHGGLGLRLSLAEFEQQLERAKQKIAAEAEPEREKHEPLPPRPPEFTSSPYQSKPKRKQEPLMSTPSRIDQIADAVRGREPIEEVTSLAALSAKILDDCRSLERTLIARIAADEIELDAVRRMIAVAEGAEEAAAESGMSAPPPAAPPRAIVTSKLAPPKGDRPFRVPRAEYVPELALLTAEAQKLRAGTKAAGDANRNAVFSYIERFPDSGVTAISDGLGMPLAGARSVVEKSFKKKLLKRTGKGNTTGYRLAASVQDSLVRERVADSAPPAAPAPPPAPPAETVETVELPQSDKADQNKETLRRWLEANGPSTTAQIVRGVGFSQPTVSKILRALVAEEEVEKVGGIGSPFRIVGSIDIDVRRKLDAPEPELEPEPETPAEPEPVKDERGFIRDVRDAVTKTTGPFSPKQIADANDWPLEATTAVLEGLLSNGTLQDESPSDDMRLYEFVKPTEPGAAAKADAKRRTTAAKGAPRDKGVDPVAGTGGKLKINDPEVRKLVADCEKAGASVAHASGSNGHLAVTKSGMKRVVISSTPRGSRAVMNDRSRLRKAGLAV